MGKMSQQGAHQVNGFHIVGTALGVDELPELFGDYGKQNQAFGNTGRFDNFEDLVLGINMGMNYGLDIAVLKLHQGRV